VALACLGSIDGADIAELAKKRRRGGHRLMDRERDEIRRCTRDPDCLRWPRGTDE
jgi:hypothetical protein